MSPNIPWNQLGHPKLLVIGDLMLDRYIWGDAERVSPEAPVLVLREDLDEVRPGGAANVASFANGLEADVVLAGVVGDDSEGWTLLRSMQDISVDTSLVVTDTSRPTTLKQRFVGRAAQRQPHQILRVDRESRRPISAQLEQRLTASIQATLASCNGHQSLVHQSSGPNVRGQSRVTPAQAGIQHSFSSNSSPRSLNDSLDSSLRANDEGTSGMGSDPFVGKRPFDAILISDYAKGACSPNLVRAVISHARQIHLPVVIDPCRGGDYQHYAGATLVTPNRTAAELLFGRTIRDPEAMRQAARELQVRLQLVAGVLTLDRDGLAYATATEQGLISCRPREVSDVTGAGDMVLAVLGTCQAARVPLVDSLHLANAAAGLEVERFGVEPITRGEIARELDREKSTTSTSLSLEELVCHIDRHRRAGKSIVFTNGCFDLLHVGHISLLEEAAKLGDILIVAINSDASIRQLKGSERPIIGENDRARMLASLASVDHVLMFEDDTPHRLLEAIKPDVLVKGGTTDEIVGREIVERYGGTIARTIAVPGFSTTHLIQRMRPSNS